MSDTELHRIIRLEKSTIEKLDCTPVEKGPKAILMMSCPLTQLMAETLKCGYVFRENGVPISTVDVVSLEHKLQDFIFKLPSATDDGGLEEFRPDLAWKFKVKRDSTAMILTYRVHISGAANGHLILDIANVHQGKKFEVTMQGIQGDLFEEVPEGTWVDMSVIACVLCDRGVPFDPRDPLRHAEGTLCDRATAVAEDQGPVSIDSKRRAANDLDDDDDEAED